MKIAAFGDYSFDIHPWRNCRAWDRAWIHSHIKMRYGNKLINIHPADAHRLYTPRMVVGYFIRNVWDLPGDWDHDKCERSLDEEKFEEHKNEYFDYRRLADACCLWIEEGLELVKDGFPDYDADKPVQSVKQRKANGRRMRKDTWDRYNERNVTFYRSSPTWHYL